MNTNYNQYRYVSLNHWVKNQDPSGSTDLVGRYLTAALFHDHAVEELKTSRHDFVSPGDLGPTNGFKVWQGAKTATSNGLAALESCART